MRWLGVIADLPGVHPTVIASNGAVLYDLASRQTLDRLCLDRNENVLVLPPPFQNAALLWQA